MSISIFTKLKLIQGHKFKVEFDSEGIADLIVDEPKPMGENSGPNPTRLLSAAVGHCLNSSLLFCLSKARINVKNLETTVKATQERNKEGFLKIKKLEAEMHLDAVIATSLLEVGVDFSNIKEIVMYGEIRSPASYKQKAGRGAREGDLDHGLFIMTIIPPSPLANFYYRHFHRLVYPSLTPLPLEPRNPDIMRAHSFCAVFDFIALNGIDVFNIISAREDKNQVEQEFDRAIMFLEEKARNVKQHVASYLRKLGLEIALCEKIAEETAAKAKEAICYLSSGYSIEGEGSKKIAIWVFEAFRDKWTMASLEDDIETNLEARKAEITSVVDARESIVIAIKKLNQALSLIDEKYKINTAQIKQLLSELEGTL